MKHQNRAPAITSVENLSQTAKPANEIPAQTNRTHGRLLDKFIYTLFIKLV